MIKVSRSIKELGVRSGPPGEMTYALGREPTIEELQAGWEPAVKWRHVLEAGGRKWSRYTDSEDKKFHLSHGPPGPGQQ